MAAFDDERSPEVAEEAVFAAQTIMETDLEVPSGTPVLKIEFPGSEEDGHRKKIAKNEYQHAKKAVAKQAKAEQDARRAVATNPVAVAKKAAPAACKSPTHLERSGGGAGARSSMSAGEIYTRATSATFLSEVRGGRVRRADQGVPREQRQGPTW